MGIDEIKELLDSYDEAYYDLDEPVVDDVEYDALKARYLRMIAGVETEVGGSVDKRFKKVPHTSPILSLEKVKDKGTLFDKMIKFQCGAIQPKLDGLTMVVYGENTLTPEPIWATRGNGTEGEDVSATARMIPGLKPIPNLAYRAEVVMLKSEFQKINKERIANGEEPFANPRNAAAGMIRQSDPNKVRGLTYYAYNIIDSELSEAKQLELLKLAGIQTVPTKFFLNNSDSIEKALNWVVGFTKDQERALPYEIDGMVIKSNIPNSLNHFGSTGHHPKNAVAYKYPTEAKWTTLRDVVWTLGKSGQVTPVAIFDEVQLFGTGVSKSTLHNYDYIRALNIKIGAEVSVTKANMIIPKIIDCRVSEGAVSQQVYHPTTCPVCHHQLQLDGANIVCRNLNCQGMIIAQVVHMANKDALDIDGLSTKTVTKMFDRGWLNVKTDIFSITPDQIETLDGYARPSAEKLYNTIQAARRDVPFHKFLYACGIPLLGRTASKDIAREFIKLANGKDGLSMLIGDMLVNRGDNLRNISGVGDSIISNIKDNVETFNIMKQFIDISYNGIPAAAKVAKQLTFVITGVLYRGTRDAYKEKIELLGHKLSGSVSKKTDYLVTNETTHTTKRQKAEELGVPIIDEEEMINLLM